jgi:hypothetical protein
MPYHGPETRQHTLGLALEITGSDGRGQLGFIGDAELRYRRSRRGIVGDQSSRSTMCSALSRPRRGS